MPWSKAVIEKVVADEQVIPFSPGEIDTKVSEQVKNFAKDQDPRHKDFRLDKIVSQITGIDEIEKASRQREVEKAALLLSKDIQEEAYKEAYALGFEEGKEEAFKSEKSRIGGEIDSFISMVKGVENLKMNLLEQNKSHILKLSFYFAKRLLMKEIAENESYVVDVVRQSLEMAQSEEQVTIRMSVEDMKFFSENKKEIFKDLDLAESTRLEESESIERGGVIVETNYGVIDATIEQRLEKLESFITKEGE